MRSDSTALPACANLVIDSMTMLNSVAGISRTLAVSSRLYLAVFGPSPSNGVLWLRSVPPTIRKTLTKERLPQTVIDALVDAVNINRDRANPAVVLKGDALPEGFDHILITAESGDWWCGEGGGITLSEIRTEISDKISAKNKLIPHLLLPFQRDKFASNLFMVPSVAEAKEHLCRAGFRVSSSFPSMLIDRETRRPIRLIEEKL
jgi:hypothetical protein